METGNEKLAATLLETSATEACRLEKKFSRYQAGNVVDDINNSNGIPVEIDSETAHLLDYADKCHDLSEGLFDITSGVLRRIWKFDGSSRIPSKTAVQEVLPFVGWHKITLSDNTISVPKGMEIDLGGIVKEYAVDRTLILLRRLYKGPLLVNFGGDVAISGPRHDEQPWNVAIDDPTHPGTARLNIPLLSGALATSGDTFRFVEHKGKRYGHILNPKTGMPVEDAPRSVTVLDDTCTNAGIMATLAMLKGADAENFLAQEEVRHWVLRN